MLMALLFVGSVFISEPVSVGQTVTRTRVVTYRRHKRSFWKKHRDKLTVAGTALGGAGLGAIAGGKKGAAIGSLVGAGGGALYTYKIRKRHRHRRY
jgi:outer membrane lipoprotein SlyB